MPVELRRGRGRPRSFDMEEAVVKILPLFHAKGYDAVGIAEITEQLGISPPSFYAAFGSKAEFYALVLHRWNSVEALPLTQILRADRSVADALVDLLMEAAQRYSRDPLEAGCLVIEGMRCDDDEARQKACSYNQSKEMSIRNYIAARYPSTAEEITDFVSTVLSGLSAKSRTGHDRDRLLATVRIAGLALALALPT